VMAAMCQTDEWLQAKIVAADGGPVSWETGWVRKRELRDSPTADMASGLLWDIEGMDEFSVSEKEMLRRNALRILADDPKCGTVIDGYRSGSREGFFYVTCIPNGGEPAYNVWFEPDS